MFALCLEPWNNSTNKYECKGKLVKINVSASIWRKWTPISKFETSNRVKAKDKTPNNVWNFYNLQFLYQNQFN